MDVACSMSLPVGTIVNANCCAQGLADGKLCKQSTKVAPNPNPVHVPMSPIAPPPGLEFFGAETNEHLPKQLPPVSACGPPFTEVDDVRALRAQEEVSTCGGRSGSSASVSEEEVSDEDELPQDPTRSDTLDVTCVRMHADGAANATLSEESSVSSANQRTGLKSSAKPFKPRLASSAKPFVPHALRAGSPNLPVLLLQAHLGADPSKQPKPTSPAVLAGFDGERSKRAMVDAANLMENILRTQVSAEGKISEQVSGDAKKVPRFCGSCGQARDVNNPLQRFCGTCGEVLSV